MIGSINDQILNIEELALETIKFLTMEQRAKTGAWLPLTEEIAALLEDAVEQGGGDEGTTRLFRLLSSPDRCRGSLRAEA